MKKRQNICYAMIILEVILAVVSLIISIIVHSGYGSWTTIALFMWTTLGVMLFGALSFYFGDSILCAIGSALFCAEIYFGYEGEYPMYICFIALLILSLLNFKIYNKHFELSFNAFCFFETVILVSAIFCNLPLYVIPVGVFLLSAISVGVLMYKCYKVNKKYGKCTLKYIAKVTRWDSDLVNYGILSFTDRDGIDRIYKCYEGGFFEQSNYPVGSEIAIYVDPDDYNIFYIGKNKVLGYIIASAVITLICVVVLIVLDML